MLKTLSIACVVMMMTAACIPTVMANEEANSILSRVSDFDIQGVSTVESTVSSGCGGGASTSLAGWVNRAANPVQNGFRWGDLFYHDDFEGVGLTPTQKEWLDFKANLSEQGYVPIPESERLSRNTTTVVSHKFLEFDESQLSNLGRFVNDTALEVETATVTSLYNRTLDDYMLVTSTAFVSPDGKQLGEAMHSVMPLDLVGFRSTLDVDPSTDVVRMDSILSLVTLLLLGYTAGVGAAGAARVSEEAALRGANLGIDARLALGQAYVERVEALRALLRGVSDATLSEGYAHAAEASEWEGYAADLQVRSVAMQSEASFASTVYSIFLAIFYIILITIVLYCIISIIYPSYTTVDVAVTPDTAFTQFTFLPHGWGDGVYIPWGSFVYYDHRDGSVSVKPYVSWWKRPFVTGLINHYIPNGTNLKIPTIFEVPAGTTTAFTEVDTAVLTYDGDMVTIIGVSKDKLKVVTEGGTILKVPG